MKVRVDNDGRFHFTVRRGDDVNVPWEFQDAGGNPISVAARVFKSQVRKHEDDSQPAAEFTINMTEAETGKVYLGLPRAITENLSGTYVWDLQQTVSGARFTPFAGTFTFERDVTR